MSDEPFDPKNEFEQKLVAAADGGLTMDALIAGMLDEQVFMPIADEESQIKGFQKSTSARPLVIQDEEGTHVLVLFSSPDRARIIKDEFPGFGGGLLADLRWVLERIDDGAGVTINPGWDIGIDLEPEVVSDLKRQAEATKTPLQ